MTKAQIFLQARAAQVKVAVFQAVFFACFVAVGIYRDGRGFGFVQYFQRAHLHFPRAVFHVGVDHVVGAFRDRSGERYNPFGAKHVRLRVEFLVFRHEHALGNATVVAQVYENYLAVVSAYRNPPPEGYFFSFMFADVVCKNALLHSISVLPFRKNLQRFVFWHYFYHSMVKGRIGFYICICIC